MYIKNIKLHGFKSFADKIDIELDQFFTGIVGPNGSGKSNIVDAIKWVLGEQSVKTLRGSNNMTDVIFSGSSSRPASNYASVTLVFDNSDRTLNIDFNEVAIKRIVYKTGENEYYINQERCRLKDITDLFMDSRSSKESFNIVPQNKIDQILSEKPEERRVIFEDAAGVLKYKRRKEESLSKLSKTHDNIERVNLIIRENSENLEPLSVSAKKAREYKEALNELESVEIALIAKDINTYSEEIDIKKNNKLKKEEKLSLIDTDNTKDSTEVEKIKLSILDIDNKIKETSSNIFKINENLIDLSNKKTLLMERIKYDKESNEVQNNLVILKDKECSLNNLISSLKFDLKTLSDNKESLDNKITNNNNSYKEVLSERERINFDLNNERKNLIDIKNKIDILESNISNMSKIPYSVKAIVGNPTLRGIHDIIANVINTKDGAIVYTGDFIIDPSMKEKYSMDIGKIAYIGKQGVLCLLSDSAFSERAGHTSPNHRLTNFFKDNINRSDGRIIFTVLPIHLFTIEEIFEAALVTRRKVVVMGKKLQSVINMAINEKYLKDYRNIMGDLSNINDKNAILLVCDDKEKPYVAIDRIVSGYDKFITLNKDDTIIFAEPRYDENEKIVVRLENEIAMLGANTISIPKDKEISHHASSEDLMLMIDLLKPKYYMPVEGEYRYMVNNADLAVNLGVDPKNIILKTNGEVVKIEDKKLIECFEKVDVGNVLIDGNTNDDIGELVIKDREMLSENGIVLVSATLDKNTKKILVGPEMTTRGFIYIKDSKEMIDNVKKISQDIIENNINNNYVDYNNIKLEIRDKLSKYFYNETECKPMIIAVIQEV